MLRQNTRSGFERLVLPAVFALLNRDARIEGPLGSGFARVFAGSSPDAYGTYCHEFTLRIHAHDLQL